MPKPHVASLAHALVLLTMSAWGYLGSADPSFTALIPGVFGVLLLACFPGVRAENKVIAHVAVGLTALIALALFMPLKGAFGRGDMGAVLRVGVMLIASIAALASFVRSFIEARRRRE